MRAIVCGEIDLCQNFESGFAEEFPYTGKKNHDCIVVVHIYYFFSKRKVEMYYSKRDKMIMMPLFAYNIYCILCSRVPSHSTVIFETSHNFRRHNGSVLEKLH